MITAEQLKEAWDCPQYRAEKLAPPLAAAMALHDITTPARIAAFLAQIGHESGRGSYSREMWGPTEAQKRYEGRLDLGNTEEGDGFKFRGRGFIQITGRANYAEVGEALNLPLTEAPAMLEDPHHAAMSAAWWWNAHHCNELADKGDFRALTRRINGGLNGYDDRLILWRKAKGVLHVE